MYDIIRGVISLVIGITFCVLAAMGQFGANSSSRIYLCNILLIAFGAFRLYRGVTRVR